MNVPLWLRRLLILVGIASLVLFCSSVFSTIGLVISGAVAIAFAAWVLPEWQIPPASRQLPIRERLKLVNEARDVLLKTVSGLVVFAGLYSTAQQLVLTREKQDEERFTHAIDQLASKEPPVRLGGIYALGQMAADAKYEEAVVEVLARYVREKAPWDGKETASAPVPPDEVQAILTIIGRPRPVGAGSKDRRVNLRTTNLRGAELQGTRLGPALLEGACLAEAQVTDGDLHGANLFSAYLHNTNLVNARLSDASLRAANLSGARLAGANLSRADLRGASMSGAVVTEANLTGAHLSGVDLTKIIGLTPKQIQSLAHD